MTSTPEITNQSLSGTTSLYDLNKHERDMISPSVRQKIINNMDSNPGLQAHLQAGLQVDPTSISKQIFLEPVDINLTDLNSLSSGVQREYLGERIFLYIKKKVGQIASKITGMIFSLPKSQLIPWAKNTHILDWMIEGAQECIKDNLPDCNAPPNTPTYESNVSNTIR